MIETADSVSKLRTLRDCIDNIDAAIVHTLAERFRCTRVIGELKDQHNLPSRDLAREVEQVSRLRHLAATSNLDPVIAQKFFALVIREVVLHHEAIRAQPRRDIAKVNCRIRTETPASSASAHKRGSRT